MNFGPPLITVDVEDWPQSSWDRTRPITERAARNTSRLLQLLDDANVRATMFVLGKFAETFPNLVREMVQNGHEVSSHGHGHIEIFKQTPCQFREDVRRSKAMLERITGVTVCGYRAPDFSIVRDTLWALEVLAECGFQYDSSIYPVRGSRYGISEWPLVPTWVELSSGRSIVEFPIATARVGFNIPVGGGGYHRLMPGVVVRAIARRMLRSRPFVFYCHPYEMDTMELRELPFEIPMALRVHQGVGRSFFEARFVRFLKEFGGQRICDVMRSDVTSANRMRLSKRPIRDIVAPLLPERQPGEF